MCIRDRALAPPPMTSTAGAAAPCVLSHCSNRCQSAPTTSLRQQGHFLASLPTSRCRAMRPKWDVWPHCRRCQP
eukprot:13721894-Alexandrium_andersonii.AAC.1